MTVEEAIKNSGTKNILAGASTKKAQSMLQPNEEVLYAINTNIIIEDYKKTLINNNKGMFSLKNAINGVIVITNNRVLFCSSILGNVNQKQILIKDIQSIEENNNVFGYGQMRICGITDTFLINVQKRNIANDMKNIIYEIQNKSREQQSITVNNNSSAADEILKFKQLLNEGIITQEEFERKKQELLK